MRTQTLPYIVVLAAALSGGLAAQGPAHRLFPPEDLGILESPDRDEWQQPDRIMDSLGIAEASRVADLGAGGGWFTVRLASRVGPNGVVFAQDVQGPMLDSIRRRVANQGLTNVQFILGTNDDPRLPTGLDAVLVVDTYPQFTQPVEILRRVAASLKPTGRLGIVDFRKDGVGGPGPSLDERVDQAVIARDARDAGLRLIREETFLRYQYLLVFEPQPAAPPTSAGRAR
jgi:ubiquinone/menaquinone biosynthesis C-methylase UbiE